MDENKEIKICCHNISYYYENNMKMPQHEQLHVQMAICKGMNQGELNCVTDDGEEITGWWKIDNG